MNVQYGSTYKDPGYSATDNYDGDISNKVEVQGIVDTKQIGTYKLYYTATDSSENSTTAVRTVTVVDTEAPRLKVNGDSYTIVKLKSEYKDSGCSAIDNHDGDISDKVKSSGKVNTSVPGYYTISYSVKDSFGNKSKATRKVQVGTKQQIDDANHILISISEQRLWFYQDGVLQLSSNAVTGTRGEHDTPRGTFRIQYKARDVYLRGPDYKTFVNYWMPIYGDIGLPHGGTSLNKYIENQCKKNSIPKISVHGLRHLYATILIEQGVPIPKISALLGHSSVHTTFDFYLDVISEKERITAFMNNTFAMKESEE